MKKRLSFQHENLFFILFVFILLFFAPLIPGDVIRCRLVAGKLINMGKYRQPKEKK